MPTRVTQADLIALRTQLGALRATQAPLVILASAGTVPLTPTATQATSATLVIERVGGTYECLEGLTYDRLEDATYEQLQLCAGQFELEVSTTQATSVSLDAERLANVPVSTTQAQAVNLARQSALTRTVSQATTVEASALKSAYSIVVASVSQTVTLARRIDLYRRISQIQLLTLPIGRLRLWRRNVRATVATEVAAGAIAQTVSTTQATSVGLARATSLTVRVTQATAAALQRAQTTVVQAAQATVLDLTLRSSAVLVATVQQAAAALEQHVSLSAIVSQVTLSTVELETRLERAITQALAAALGLAGPPPAQTLTAEQATNVSLLKSPLAVLEPAEQAQVASLTLELGRVLAAAQPTSCSLIVQTIPVGGIEPSRIFSACYARRVRFTTCQRRSTFTARRRDLTFTGRSP